MSKLLKVDGVVIRYNSKFLEITWGITSPALCNSIVSPILMSFLSISSWLWRETLETLTPPTITGSNSATGVNVPVLPTWILIFFMC